MVASVCRYVAENGSAAILVTNRLAGVAPEVTHNPLSSVNKAAHSGFETHWRCHQKSNTGVSVAPQKKNLKNLWFFCINGLFKRFCYYCLTVFSLRSKLNFYFTLKRLYCMGQWLILSDLKSTFFAGNNCLLISYQTQATVYTLRLYKSKTNNMGH